MDIRAGFADSVLENLRFIGKTHPTKPRGYSLAMPKP